MEVGAAGSSRDGKGSILIINNCHSISMQEKYAKLNNPCYWIIHRHTHSLSLSFSQIHSLYPFYNPPPSLSSYHSSISSCLYLTYLSSLFLTLTFLSPSLSFSVGYQVYARATEMRISSNDRKMEVFPRETLDVASRFLLIAKNLKSSAQFFLHPLSMDPRIAVDYCF